MFTIPKWAAKGNAKLVNSACIKEVAEVIKVYCILAEIESGWQSTGSKTARCSLFPKRYGSNDMSVTIL